MNSVVQTSIAVSRKQLRCNNLVLRSVSSATSFRSVQIKSGREVCSLFQQKRTITLDSWAAKELTAKGEILTSIDHKPMTLVDLEYCTGTPPPEVLRICNKILALSIVDVHILVKTVVVSIVKCYYSTFYFLPHILVLSYSSL